MVRLEDVRFTPKFSCPHCAKDIRISDRYQRAFQVVSWTAGLGLPFCVGIRGWLLLVLWIPCSMLIMALWEYVGKYLFPPRLQLYVPKPTSTLGLD